MGGTEGCGGVQRSEQNVSEVTRGVLRRAGRNWVWGRGTLASGSGPRELLEEGQVWGPLGQPEGASTWHWLLGSWVAPLLLAWATSFPDVSTGRLPPSVPGPTQPSDTSRFRISHGSEPASDEETGRGEQVQGHEGSAGTLGLVSPISPPTSPLWLGHSNTMAIQKWTSVYECARECTRACERVGMCTVCKLDPCRKGGFLEVPFKPRRSAPDSLIQRFLLVALRLLSPWGRLTCPREPVVGVR